MLDTLSNKKIQHLNRGLKKNQSRASPKLQGFGIGGKVSNAYWRIQDQLSRRPKQLKKKRLKFGPFGRAKIYYFGLLGGGHGLFAPPLLDPLVAESINTFIKITKIYYFKRNKNRPKLGNFRASNIMICAQGRGEGCTDPL